MIYVRYVFDEQVTSAMAETITWICTLWFINLRIGLRTLHSLVGPTSMPFHTSFIPSITSREMSPYDEENENTHEGL